MENLAEKIEDYSEELFADLGLVALSDERKADLFARVQEHFHEVILSVLSSVLNRRELEKLHNALEQENYSAVVKILKRRPEFKTTLEEKIEHGFKQLKLSIAEEQKNAGTAIP